MDTSFSGVITLIHGTFANDAKWITADSVIFKRLSNTYPNASVKMFQWSGGNSHRARTLAGAELASVIEAQLSIAPETKHILIAHSHGGNVALYATRSGLVASAVTSIIFLSTPFFHCKKREVARMFSFFGPILSWLLIFPIYMPFGDMALMSCFEWLLSSADRGALFSFIVSVVLVGFYVYKGWRKSLSRWLSQGLPIVLDKKAEFYFSKISTPPIQCKWLALYTIGDEALLWLKSLSFISAIPMNSMGIITSVFTKLSPVVFFCSAVITLVLTIRDGGSDYGTNLVSEYILIPYILGCLLSVVIYLLGYLIPPLIRGNKIGFGSEGFFVNALIEILPRAAPDSLLVEGSGSFLFKPSARYSGLKHSASYTDSEAVDLIVSFVGGQAPSYGKPRVTASRRGGVVVKMWGGIAITAIALGSIYYVSARDIKEMSTSIDPSLKIETRRPLVVVKEVLQAESTKKIYFAVNQDFVKQHCHLSGLYKSDTRSGTINVSLDDWYTLTQEQIDIYKKDPSISEDFKLRLKPVSEYSSSSVLNSVAERKRGAEFWFEKHPRTNLSFIKSGEVLIGNVGGTKSANIELKLYLDCYAQ